MKTFDQLYNELGSSIQNAVKQYITERMHLAEALSEQTYLNALLASSNTEALRTVFTQYNQTLSADQREVQTQRAQKSGLIGQMWNTTAQLTTKVFHTGTAPISDDRIRQIFFLVRCLNILSNNKTNDVKAKNEIVTQVLEGLEILMTSKSEQTVRVGVGMMANLEEFKLPPIETSSYRTSQWAARVSETVGYTNGANACKSVLGNMIRNNVFPQGIETLQAEFKEAYTKALEDCLYQNSTLPQIGVSAQGSICEPSAQPPEASVDGSQIAVNEQLPKSSPSSEQESFTVQPGVLYPSL